MNTGAECFKADYLLVFLDRITKLPNDV